MQASIGNNRNKWTTLGGHCWRLLMVVLVHACKNVSETAATRGLFWGQKDKEDEKK